MDVEFAKVDEDRHVVYGWASIIARDGAPVGDHQGDVIGLRDLEDAAHAYVHNHRVGKAMHAGASAADLIESMVVGPDTFGALCKAQGMDAPDPLPVAGWWVGFKVHDDAVWQRVKSGELRAFSIGGTGTRTPLPE